MQSIFNHSTVAVQDCLAGPRVTGFAKQFTVFTFALVAGLAPLRAETAAQTDVSPVAAPSEAATRSALFKKTLKHPTDAALAMSYVNVCIGLHDYEGAIGTLERMLYYAPNDKTVQAQLGLLYAQLHSDQTAKQYFDAASGPGLDDVSRERVTAAMPSVRDGIAGSHVFGTLQTGVRYQTNAAFNPDNNILRVSNQDYLLSHPRDGGSDGNAFQLAQIGYDYDVGNQRGDIIEARLAGYATQQFQFTDLNVGLYDLSLGPRFAISPDHLPGWSVKPYATGGQIFLAGQRYLSSGGVGIVADLAIRPNLLLQPGAEVRHVSFSGTSVFSSLNTGEAAIVSLNGTGIITPFVSVVGRLVYTHDSASADYQTSSDYAEELALVLQAPPPLRFASAPWTVSPYVKLLQSRFEGPNPYIDASTVRRDNEVQTGVVLNMPVNARFDITGNVQYANVASNIPNYRLHNFAVLAGPAVRF